MLTYSDLHVFDATGRELPSAMRLSTADVISLVVDDRDAVYPVLVDPWVRHNPLTAPTSQSGASFGHSVVYYERLFNNQYFGSVIVGAPSPPTALSPPPTRTASPQKSSMQTPACTTTATAGMIPPCSAGSPWIH